MKTSRKLDQWRHAHRQVASAKAGLDALGDEADEGSLALRRAILNDRLVEQAMRFSALSRRDRAIALKEVTP